MVKNVFANLLFAAIFWDVRQNKRSANNYGSERDRNELVQSFADSGWSPHYPATVYPITADGITEALKQRQSEWDALRGTADTSEGKERLAVFESLFTKNGKLIQPEYYGNSGFRRSKIFFDSMVKRSLEKQELLPTVPVVVKDYRSDIERILDQQEENGKSELGTVRITAENKLAITRELFGYGAKQTDIRKLYGSSTGMKMFAICQLDKTFPGVKLIERFNLPEESPDYLPLSAYRHADLVKMVNRAEATAKRASGQTLTGTEKGLDDLPEAKFVDWVMSVAGKKSEGNASPIMKRADIEGKAKNHDCKLVNLCFDAVLKNDDKLVNTVNPFSKELNLLTNSILAGNGESTVRPLVKLFDYPELVKVITDQIGKGIPVASIIAAVLAVKHREPDNNSEPESNNEPESNGKSKGKGKGKTVPATVNVKSK